MITRDGSGVAEDGQPALAVLDEPRDGGARRRPLAAAVARRIVGALLAIVLAWGSAVFVLGLVYTVVPPASTLMLGRWLSGESVTRDFVPLEEISPHLAVAVITSEDARFCQHWGVDWGALKQVVEAADEDGPSRGASTIPMQTAKNLFLWPSRSYIRKGLELPLALYIDLVWSKHRMIEVYLNIVEWGDGTFGAEAAARRYFNKSARALTRREAALLASALPSPLRRNPGRPSAGHRSLADRLLNRIEAAGPVDACVRAAA